MRRNREIKKDNVTVILRNAIRRRVAMEYPNCKVGAYDGSPIEWVPHFLYSYGAVNNLCEIQIVDPIQSVEITCNFYRLRTSLVMVVTTMTDTEDDELILCNHRDYYDSLATAVLMTAEKIKGLL